MQSSSSAIEALRKEPGLAFFYFDFQNSIKQTISGVLSSLISQLAFGSEACNHHLTKFYQAHIDTHPEHPNDDLLLECLNGMLEALQNVYLVWDALDELPKSIRKRDLFPLFQRLIESKNEGLHILVTSCPEQDIKKGFQSHITLRSDSMKEFVLEELNLDIMEDHTHDINRYISENISMIDNWPVTYKKTAQESLIMKANGM